LKSKSQMERNTIQQRLNIQSIRDFLTQFVQFGNQYNWYFNSRIRVIVQKNLQS
jgi:hypothetical protein